MVIKGEEWKWMLLTPTIEIEEVYKDSEYSRRTEYVAKMLMKKGISLTPPLILTLSLMMERWGCLEPGAHQLSVVNLR